MHQVSFSQNLARLARIAGWLVAILGVAGAIFQLGVWKQTYSYDKEKRELADQVATLSATNREQAGAVKKLQEDKQALKDQLGDRNAVSHENATLKESGSTTLSALRKLETENADLKQTVTDLRNQVSANDRRKDLLRRIEALDAERTKLLAKVESTLRDRNALRPALARDSERCLLYRTGVMSDTMERLSVCANATELSDKVQRSDQELSLAQDRIKAIESDVSRLQSQL